MVDYLSFQCPTSYLKADNGNALASYAFDPSQIACMRKLPNRESLDSKKRGLAMKLKHCD